MTGSTGQETPHRTKYSDELIEFGDIPMDSPIRELTKKLSVNRSSYDRMPEGSIMGYEKICTHDSAYLCECRLQYIVDYLNKNITKNKI